MGQAKSGIALSDIASTIAGSDEAKRYARIPGFATGGDFGGGIAMVGEQGPEIIQTGPARIFSAQQTSSLLSRIAQPVDNSAAVVAEIRALREENRQLRSMTEAHLYAIAKNALKSADALDGAVNGVRPIVVVLQTA
jgi:phage-related minor tail protein